MQKSTSFLKNLFLRIYLCSLKESVLLVFMNSNIRPANTFPVGSLISIDGVSAMKKLRVDYVSDGCVTVYGKDSSDGTDHTFTISGSSPAVPYVAYSSLSKEQMDGRMNRDGVSYSIDEVVKERAPRGSLTEKMKNPTVPLGKFTIAEFADLNEVPYPYAMKWVKENCSPAGFKDRVEGQRGKTAELFQKL